MRGGRGEAPRRSSIVVSPIWAEMAQDQGVREPALHNEHFRRACIVHFPWSEHVWTTPTRVEHGHGGLARHTRYTYTRRGGTPPCTHPPLFLNLIPKCVISTPVSLHWGSSMFPLCLCSRLPLYDS